MDRVEDLFDEPNRQTRNAGVEDQNRKREGNHTYGHHKKPRDHTSDGSLRELL